ncbi:GTP-binding protein RAD isoform X2 [Drosophila innubila]|uniref:GTP-binding protein RAD isoform X2 n=1 Tax=Drosophila innubila TaxID=198719 RepID=UPI00148E7E53|nr:GTP-binding protein RAD isoform X2 [Drosophila innubila]
MVDDVSPMHHRMQKKTRSASICATGASIETVIHNMPSGSATPEGGTPGYRRRRPATRSQSARITSGARSVRRRTQTQQQQQQQNTLQDTRSYCTSEPRLSETETPPQRRKLSQRRPQPHGHRKSNAFLDVPTMNMHHLRVNDDDEDVDRLRTFSASKGGIINRGDSFRRRRSRSNSLAPVSPMHARNAMAGLNGGAGGGGGGGSSLGLGSAYNGGGSHSNGFGEQPGQENHQPVEFYRVEMLGSAGVGKQALVSQFRTSDCINAYDGPECDEGEQNISIILNGTESELKILTGNTESKDELEQADAFLVVYSCIDKESFTRAKQILSRLQDMDLLRHRPTILVANKIDLARSRAVSAQDGKCVACTFGAKFIEVSVGINHNCDELLAGTLTQIRLKKDHNRLQGHRDGSSPAHWYKSRSVMLASMKARQMLTWILGKEDSKFKHCENLQVL